MKKIALILSLSTFIFSFTTTHIDSFKVDTKKSTLKWTGSKITASHYGNISVSEGAIMMDHGKLVAANFTIDMNTITNTDVKDKGKNEYFVQHLKSEDFFDVANFPKADFKMITATKIAEGKFKVTGELNIKKYKDIITFDLEATERYNTMNASGKFSFDRTKFDIIYGSGTFFDDLGDKAIDNEVIIEFNIVANK
jgi:polyisoprenoid-binding protein YceI